MTELGPRPRGDPGGSGKAGPGATTQPAGGGTRGVSRDAGGDPDGWRPSHAHRLGGGRAHASGGTVGRFVHPTRRSPSPSIVAAPLRGAAEGLACRMTADQRDSTRARSEARSPAGWAGATRRHRLGNPAPPPLGTASAVTVRFGPDGF
jgi:hypothetical protein